MLRPIWWQPFYASAVASATTVSYTDHWAWPVTTQLDASNITIANDPAEMAEFGHRERVS